MHCPAKHTVPAAHVLSVHGSTHAPLVLQTNTPEHVTPVQLSMHRPLAHFFPAPQLTTLHESWQTPATHVCPAVHDTPTHASTQLPETHFLPPVHDTPTHAS